MWTTSNLDSNTSPIGIGWAIGQDDEEGHRYAVRFGAKVLSGRTWDPGGCVSRMLCTYSCNFSRSWHMPEDVQVKRG